MQYLGSKSFYSLYAYTSIHLHLRFVIKTLATLPLPDLQQWVHKNRHLTLVLMGNDTSKTLHSSPYIL
jgi:hypothetical protein